MSEPKTFKRTAEWATERAAQHESLANLFKKRKEGQSITLSKWCKDHHGFKGKDTPSYKLYLTYVHIHTRAKKEEDPEKWLRDEVRRFRGEANERSDGGSSASAPSTAKTTGKYSDYEFPMERDWSEMEEEDQEEMIEEMVEGFLNGEEPDDFYDQATQIAESRFCKEFPTQTVLGEVDLQQRTVMAEGVLQEAMMTALRKQQEEIMRLKALLAGAGGNTVVPLSSQEQKAVDATYGLYTDSEDESDDESESSTEESDEREEAEEAPQTPPAAPAPLPVKKALKPTTQALLQRAAALGLGFSVTDMRKTEAENDEAMFEDEESED